MTFVGMLKLEFVPADYYPLFFYLHASPCSRSFDLPLKASHVTVPTFETRLKNIVSYWLH
ncbi:hypothetical protein [Polaribacter irgensii]|uniref:hypothetical protein n=1 Tax=Polaribacter irgensii TaxID=531 RepID=UPI0002D9D87F|nr:hypothetical protein [Polaribacter irgensii]